MTTIKNIRESKTARWIAMVIVSLTMMFGYFFMEILSPLKPYLEKEFGWTSSEFGLVTGAYGWLNVFAFMLIWGGIILDKKGVRFTGIGSVLVMILGGCIKYYSFVGEFSSEQTILGISEQVFFVGMGYAIFAVGVEAVGITASKIVVRWFKGKELALGMGLQVALARLGSFGALAFAPMIAEKWRVSAAVLVGLILLCIGLLNFMVYNVMDRKLDAEIRSSESEAEEPFRLSEIKLILTNRGFWYLAILCVMFYSAVFPFYKFGPDLMVNKFGVDPKSSGLIPSLIPFGTLLLTPVFGSIYDKKGKGASIMILGSIMLIIVHVLFAIPSLTNISMAIGLTVLLGIAFSLVPSAMWPALTKIVPERQLGTAYALTFYVQNWGLMGIPTLLGFVLDKTNPGIATAKADGVSVDYDYSQTWLILVACTFISLIFAILLKIDDRKRGYGLELPNIESK